MSATATLGSPNRWTPNLLPTSADRPSIAPVSGEAVVRPFGLTRTCPVADGDTVELDNDLRYDPQRQVNVLADGSTAVDMPDSIPRAGTSYDTRHDNQWFVDQD